MINCLKRKPILPLCMSNNPLEKKKEEIIQKFQIFVFFFANHFKRVDIM